nr:MAG TPA: hypothetical protein [Caudoviricetes sp.]
MVMITVATIVKVSCEQVNRHQLSTVKIHNKVISIFFFIVV